MFNSFSLGIGADGVPGDPLIEAYLTGKELKTVAEIDASVSDLMTSARLYMYGLQFTYNPHRMILNRVTDVYLLDADGNRRELEDDKLYRGGRSLQWADAVCGDENIVWTVGCCAEKGRRNTD